MAHPTSNGAEGIHKGLQQSRELEFNKERFEKEKLVRVDPKSLEGTDDCPLFLLPAKPKWLGSSSLPNLATSSPRFPSSTLISMQEEEERKKKKNENKRCTKPESHHVSSSYHHSPKAPSLQLQRSTSCDAGRAYSLSLPPDEFDLWPSKRPPCADSGRNRHHRHPHHHRHHLHRPCSLCDAEGNNKIGSGRKDVKGFKCGGALMCLLLPGFGKGGKPVRARSDPENATTAMSLSRTVSLEKFECGSWSSSAIVNDVGSEDGGEESSSSHLYFDLPMELIRGSLNDAESPVAAAFVFQKKDIDHHGKKGVLKRGGPPGKSHDLSPSRRRHVRFSTSSPSSPCITPRLLKARDDFNAFLTASS